MPLVRQVCPRPSATSLRQTWISVSHRPRDCARGAHARRL